MTIFDIKKELLDVALAITESVDPETGELRTTDADITEKMAMYDALEMSRQEKVENTIKVHEQIQSEIDGLLPLIEKMSKRLGSLKKNLADVERLIEYGTDGQAFKSPYGNVVYTESKALELTDEATFYEWASADDNEMSGADKYASFVTRKETYAPNKKALKKYMADGGIVPGAAIVIHKNMKIK